MYEQGLIYGSSRLLARRTDGIPEWIGDWIGHPGRYLIYADPVGPGHFPIVIADPFFFGSFPYGYPVEPDR